MRFSHNFCLHSVAWIHPAHVWTKRGDIDTTSPTVLARQEPLPKQSKYRFTPFQHLPLIIAQAPGAAVVRPPQESGQREWATGQFNGRESVDSRGSGFRVQALLQFRQECLALSIGLPSQSAGDNAAFPDSREHRIGSAAAP